MRPRSWQNLAAAGWSSPSSSATPPQDSRTPRQARRPSSRLAPVACRQARGPGALRHRPHPHARWRSPRGGSLCGARCRAGLPHAQPDRSNRGFVVYLFVLGPILSGVHATSEVAPYLPYQAGNALGRLTSSVDAAMLGQASGAGAARLGARLLRLRGSGEHRRLRVAKAPDPLADVRECCRASVAVEKALGEAIRDAIAAGHTWAQVGQVLDVGASTSVGVAEQYGVCAVGCGRGSGGPPGRRPVEARIDVIRRGLPALRCDRQVRGGHGSRRVRLRRQLPVQSSSPQQVRSTRGMPGTWCCAAWPEARASWSR